jgi:serine/threonine protein kinase
MDHSKAKELETRLKDRQFLDYKILGLINYGKSAAVFRATDTHGNFVAIKVFDNELVERFGHEIQLKRINDEINLTGHQIPHLVEIIAGGHEKVGESYFYYIIMAFIDGKNLKEFIASETYGNDFVKNVVKVLFEVSEALLNKNIAHRDIKPENIMIDIRGKITLMDLGVLKLVGAQSFTDIEEKQFLGTLRYAPPQFLLRTEKDTTEGWRSVNLYQIGCVLHDLLMKKELFQERQPYSQLVIAIKEDAPTISNSAFPFDTNQLARDLLIKDWTRRLEICTTDRLFKFYSKSEVNTSLDSALDELFMVRHQIKTKVDEIESIKRSNEERSKIRFNIAENIENFVEQSLVPLLERGVITKKRKLGAVDFPVVHQTRVMGSGHFNIPATIMKHAQESHDDFIDRTIVFALHGELAIGFTRPLILLVRNQNTESGLARISISCLSANSGISFSTNNLPAALIAVAREFNSRKPGYPGPDVHTFVLKSVELFYGTVSFDEKSRELITTKILLLLRTALDAAMPKVVQLLEEQEKIARLRDMPVQKTRDSLPSEIYDTLGTN